MKLELYANVEMIFVVLLIVAVVVLCFMIYFGTSNPAVCHDTYNSCVGTCTYFKGFMYLEHNATCVQNCNSVFEVCIK